MKADVVGVPVDCSTDPAPCQPVCSLVSGLGTTCAPLDLQCLDPATGDLYPCPLPAERIVFSSGADLESYLSTLYDASEVQLRAAEQQRGPALSLRGYLDNGESTEAGALAWAYTDGPTGNEAIALQNDGVFREDFEVSDAFLSILNEKGEVQVGDSIYKVTRDNAYVVAPENLALLSQLVPTLSSPAPAADPRIVVNPVETSVSDEEPLLVRTADGASDGSSIRILKDACVELFDGGTKRMKGTSYITNLGIYGEAGVRTQWERKKFFGWSNTWQDGMLAYDHSASLRRASGTPIWQSPRSGSNFGATQISRILASGWFMSIHGWISTTHVVSNSFGYRECYTNVVR
ncbi:MAG TPA: hypothetical protein VLK66_04400 [Longimicrobium sp.]|nr:hypothetical protein [Longimicrobium sp.]